MSDDLFRPIRRVLTERAVVLTEDNLLDVARALNGTVVFKGGQPTLHLFGRVVEVGTMRTEDGRSLREEIGWEFVDEATDDE